MGKRPTRNPIERKTNRRGSESRGADRLSQPKRAQATLSSGSRSHRQYILALLLVVWTAASFWRPIRIDPDYAEAYCNLGLALAKDGEMDAAVANFREALRAKPGFPPALKYLELALGKK